MKTICCICDEVLKDDHQGNSISHGYCNRCRDLTMETYKRIKTHYVSISHHLGITYSARLDDIDSRLFNGLKDLGFTKVEVW